MLGQCHGGELGFIFGTWDSNVVFRLMGGLSVWNRRSAVAQGRAMESLWGEVLNSFVRTGVPAAKWSKYDGQNLAMALHPDGLTEIPATAKAAEHMCSLMDNHRRPYGLT